MRIPSRAIHRISHMGGRTVKEGHCWGKQRIIWSGHVVQNVCSWVQRRKIWREYAFDFCSSDWGRINQILWACLNIASDEWTNWTISHLYWEFILTILHLLPTNLPFVLLLIAARVFMQVKLFLAKLYSCLQNTSPWTEKVVLIIAAFECLSMSGTLETGTDTLTTARRLLIAGYHNIEL